MAVRTLPTSPGCTTPRCTHGALDEFAEDFVVDDGMDPTPSAKCMATDRHVQLLRRIPRPVAGPTEKPANATSRSRSRSSSPGHLWLRRSECRLPSRTQRVATSITRPGMKRPTDPTVGRNGENDRKVGERPDA